MTIEVEGLRGRKKQYDQGKILRVIGDSTTNFAVCSKCGSETNLDKIIAEVDAKSEKIEKIMATGKGGTPHSCTNSECGKRVYLAQVGGTLSEPRIVSYVQRKDLLPLGSKKPLGFYSARQQQPEPQ